VIAVNVQSADLTFIRRKTNALDAVATISRNSKRLNINISIVWIATERLETKNREKTEKKRNKRKKKNAHINTSVVAIRNTVNIVRVVRGVLSVWIAKIWIVRVIICVATTIAIVMVWNVDFVIQNREG